MGVQMPQREETLLRKCLAHCEVQDFGGLVKMLSCSKTDGPTLTIYTSYDVILHNEVPLRVAM